MWYPASGAALDDKTIGLIISNRDAKLGMLAYCHFDDTAVHFVPLGMRLGAEPKCPGRDIFISPARSSAMARPLSSAYASTAPPRQSRMTSNESSCKFRPPFPENPVYSGTHGWFQPRPVPPSSRREATRASPTVPWTSAASTFGLHQLTQHVWNVAVGITGRYAAVLDMKLRLDAFKPKNDLGLVHHVSCGSHLVPPIGHGRR
ncbi:hypothetical protein C8J57DRAFT_1218547 [Mycena rebaudengoi]|nr:hypothetical protein C8J57DRAFT_1218547 [Mycena rebaudengoi]